MKSFRQISRGSARAIVEDVGSALEKRLDGIRTAAYFNAIPPALCHYTRTFESLAGILRSKEIWACDFAAQASDPYELRHVDGAVVAMARTLAQDPSMNKREVAWLCQFAERWPSETLAERGAGQFFIACFSEPNDNPKLWDCFASGCSGYAIEFETLNEENPTPGLYLGISKVEYSEPAAVARLERVFRETFAAYRSDVHPALNIYDWPQSRVRQALRVAAATTAAQTKSSEHERDQEWRLVVLTQQSDLINRSNPARAHVAVPIRYQHARPAIRAVHIGSLAAHAEDDVANLFREAGYDDTNMPAIVRSKVFPNALTHAKISK